MRPRMRSLVMPLVFAACATTTGAPPNQPPPLPPPEPAKPQKTVFVSPEGNDTALGTKELPYKTIARALSVEAATDVSIARGEYAEKELVIARRIALAGPADGGAVLAGRIVIRGANEVRIDHLDVAQGIGIDRSVGVFVGAGSVRAGDHAHAISIGDRSRVVLRDLEMRCGSETCLEISSSTTTIRHSWMFGEAATKRGLRAVTSSVTVRELEVTGTETNQILVGRRTKMSLEDAKLTGARGSALTAVEDANVQAARVTIADAQKFSVLVQSSHVVIEKSAIGATKGLGVGVTGGDVELVDCEIESSPDGAISVGAFNGKLSAVKLTRGTIRHGRKPGALVSQGVLTVVGTRFIGDVSAKTDEGDAIIASSVDAGLAIISAQIDTPAGFGITMTNGASGTITATIAKPRGGGIYIDGVAGAEVTVRGSRIEGCSQGSGIAVQDSTDVKIIATTVIGCPEAGILAGSGANLDVERARLVNNREYGVAAFGRAVIELSSSKISSSRWATFASCGDGARIEDGGNNRLLGQTTTCP